MAGKPICSITATTITGGKCAIVPAKSVLASGKPVLTGFGPVTPHPPTPYPITHSMGFVIPTSTSVLINGLPPIRYMDKTTCGCTIVDYTNPTVICG
jgi:uncharacterized Zn-binding protein involved in type VI secretion